ncbi:MAG TPA: sigma 54-interacting transcriptional regulator [Thermoanaerobaculia bacterium]|nr:sigma 54-interacting transcriptional regulator [Thermoanaerobaculia bacterium]
MSRAFPAAPLARAAESARRLFSFDAMWALLEAGDSCYHLSFAGEPEEAAIRVPAEQAPRFLRPERPHALDDVPAALDSETPVGRALARRELRSLLVVPISGGHLGFGSRSTAAFQADEERFAEAIGSLLSASLEQSLALSREREARERLEIVSSLPRIVASTLDIRDVFHQVSEITKAAVPHESLGIQLVQPDRKTIVAHVVTDRLPADEWKFGMSFELNENDMVDGIVEDVWFDGPGDSGLAHVRGRLFLERAGPEGVAVDVAIDAHRSRLVRDHGFHSFLRTVLRRGGEKIGSLVFASTRPSQYRVEQFEIAHRIADQVSMALAHRHLAEEAERAAEARARAAMLEDRVQELVAEAEEREGFHRCVGESAAWKEVLKQAARVAATDTTVLLTGESGTGKEVVARFIHRGSPRSKGPLVAVNCAALPEQLLESELFGYERGAFTGALQAKPGRIEQAARGVLFLDEIGEMSLALQAKLLRVLQEREFQRLGGTRTLRADIRVVAATNRDLVGAMKRGEFREDLFYRLRVFEIRLPPLRERREDVLPLTEAFLADLEKTLGQRTAGLSREAREILLSYDWPGNIRELRNALERAMILCDGGLITAEQLPLGIGEAPRAPAGGAAGAGVSVVNLEIMERELIERALLQAGNNKSKAARLLGLSRAQLYFRLEKYGFVEASDS